MNIFLRFSVAALILYGVSSSFCGALHAADDVYAKDDKGRTQLHRAALEGDIGELKRLRGMGFDVNDPDKHGYTPLHLAVRGDHGAAVEVLFLWPGVDLTLTDSYEHKTPEQMARAAGKLKIAARLQKYAKWDGARAAFLAAAVASVQ
jgi:ankyrin repeat protein